MSKQDREDIRVFRSKLKEEAKWQATMFATLAATALGITIIHFYNVKNPVSIVVIAGATLTIIELIMARSEYKRYKKLERHEEEERK